LEEIKGFIQTAATALYSVPGSPPAPLIPDFKVTGAPPSADFRAIAVDHLQVPALTIKDMFDNHIVETKGKLETKIESYDQSRQNLLDNIQHCTDDTDDPDLLQHIENNEIRDNYKDLIANYERYKDDSSVIYTDITQEVVKIVDTGIDDDEQRQKTKDLFEIIQNKCTAFADVVTGIMGDKHAEIADFEKSVDTYISEVVTDLTTRLIDCINRSIVDAETKIVSERDAIDSTSIDKLFDTGDRVISEIEELLAELAQLEAAGP
jgi:hypothetical protein